MPCTPSPFPLPLKRGRGYAFFRRRITSRIGEDAMRWSAFVFALLCSPPAHADGVADFYAGKTIGMIIGSDPGGSYDLNARLVATYLSKYIPGHPAIVPQNLVGAGGIVGANHVVNVGAKDG